MLREMVFAGFGGQGIMTMGTMLATAAMHEGRDVTWLPSYGAEQRGGTANCTVVVSDEPIGSPIVDAPGIVVAMNLPSLDKFGPRTAPGGFLFVNSSLVKKSPERDDLVVYLVPANDLAIRAGSARIANMAMLGAVVARTGVIEMASLEKLLRETAKGKAKELLPLNLAALEEGRRFVET
jgi:2-oxoglutarate ferredoxin oxidoreductase subunit gamma